RVSRPRASRPVVVRVPAAAARRKETSTPLLAERNLREGRSRGALAWQAVPTVLPAQARFGPAPGAPPARRNAGCRIEFPSPTALAASDPRERSSESRFWGRAGHRAGGGRPVPHRSRFVPG